MDIIASVDTYTPEMPPSLKYEVEQPSYNQEINLNHNFNHNLEGIYPALPPSFTSLIANCSEVREGRFPLPVIDRNISSDTIR